MPPGLVAGLPYLAFACNGSGERSWSTRRWSDYTGLSFAASLGLGWLDAVHPDDRDASMRAWALAPATGCHRVEHRIRSTRDGAYRWHLTVAERHPALGGGGASWIGGSDDVGDLRRRLQEASAEALRQREFIEGVPHLLWRSSSGGDWLWASPQWLAFTGQTQAQSQGQGWLDAVHPDDRTGAAEAWDLAQPHGELDVSFRVWRQADGAYLWHRTRSLPLRDAGGRIVEWLGSTTDVHDLQALQDHQKAMLAEAQRHAQALEDEIRDRKQAEARLLHEAHHDALTGLNSRAFLVARLQEALDEDGSGQEAGCAVLLLDLDRFKLVNGSLGHDAGDALLAEMAKRLRACVGHLDATLARFDGDEFAILLRGAGDVGAAETVAEQVIATVRRPIRLVQQEVFSSCRLGLTHAARGGGATPEEMLRNADIAMCRASRGGGCVVFTEAMRGDALEMFALRTDLQRALARAELRVRYQPICDAGSRRILGLEALVRWQHPRRGLVPPDAFIRIAEEMGLIREIDGWVLGEACRQMVAWRDRFPRLGLYLNVNSSGEGLKHPRFTTDLVETLDRTGLDPHLLQIEVTENVFLQQPDHVGEILDGIRRIGVRVALDDFGTGYSSLSYLDRYRVDTIKIDRSFVSGLQVRPNALTIVQTIIRLGQGMALGVIAEGVEDEVQLEALRTAGCRIVQGYLLGRPAGADDITAALALQG